MTRRELDAYYTETAVTLELLKHLIIPPNCVCIEPCNGVGNISKTLENKYGGKVWTNDINTEIQGLDWYSDASDPESNMWLFSDGYDLCISNPPYNLANKIVPLIYNHCTITAVLMRLSWLEPTKERQEFLQAAQQHLSLIGILNPRPKFGSKGTDSVTSCWLVWDKNKSPIVETKIIFMDKWQQNE